MNQLAPLHRWKRLLGPYGPLVLLTGLCALIALAMLKVPWFFVVAGVLALLVAAAVVAEPYYGVLLYILLLYARPGDMFPPLAPLRLTLLGVALLAGAFVLQTLVYRRIKPILTKPMIFMVLFFLVMVASVPGSFYRSLSISKIEEVARIVFMTYLVVQLVDTVPRVRKFMALLTVVLAVLATIVVLRYSLMPWTRIEGTGGSGGVAGGFLGDGNDFALALNVVLPWSIALVGIYRSRIMKLLFVYCAVISSLAVIVTFSRGGFLGLVTVFGCYFLLWMVRNRAYASGLLLGLLGITVAIGAFLAFAPQKLQDRVMGIQNYEEDESAVGRLDAWGAGLRMFRDRPLLGVGVGAFSIAYGTKYFPPDAVAANWREAHSVFFQVLGELGLSGVVTFWGLFFSLFFLVHGLRFTRLGDRGEDRFFHKARSAVLVSLAGWLVTAAFLSVAYYPHLFILVMVSATLQRLARERAIEELPEIVEIEEV